MFSELDTIASHDALLRQALDALSQAVTLPALVLAALTVGRLVAVRVLEDLLQERGRTSTTRPKCPQCHAVMESRGLVPRVMQTLIGRLQWKRRAWRCPWRCQLGLVAPYDAVLGLTPYQRVSLEVRQLTSLLAVFVPYALAARLFRRLTQVAISPGGIWQWVQQAGAQAMSRLAEELAQAAVEEPAPEEIPASLQDLPLLIGGDGILVPFRPQADTPEGKTVWREIKVGIVTRLGHRVTRTGKQVTVLLRRRLVAVLGDIDALRDRLWLTALKAGLRTAPLAAWLSDGGPGLWRLYRERFKRWAVGILDFYHAAQHLWKAARATFDGRTTRARTWFACARHALRQGEAAGVIQALRQHRQTTQLPPSVRATLANVITYLETHRRHLAYLFFEDLGLPRGSGLVESACKWLIQQRFKGVGMRWSEKGFNHLLHLRLAWVNGTFDDLFQPGSCSARRGP
jgi:hypothetical protein